MSSECNLHELVGLREHDVLNQEDATAFEEALSELSSEGILSDSLITLDPSELEQARLDSLNESANDRPC